MEKNYMNAEEGTTPYFLWEKEIVEKPLLEQLQSHGWEYIPSETLGRESPEDVLLLSNLRAALLRINERMLEGISQNEKKEVVEEVIRELKTRGSGIEGHKQIMDLLKYGLPVNLGKKGLATIQLFDYINIEKNEFIVSNQVTFTSINGKIRADLVLFVNGIPLVLVECKDPTNPTVSWENAYLQIKDYEKKVPELFKYIQINTIIEKWEEKARYFPAEPWNENTQVHVWKSENGLCEFLQPKILLDIVKYFSFFREEKGCEKKVLVRYMQYRAVNKIVERAKKYVKGEDDKAFGLIWHWQGSGKTLTMIFAANKLMRLPDLENPTILFVLDRKELEDQTTDEIKSVKIDFQPSTITSISELKETLLWDEGRGKRGIFVVLVHKFRPGELQEVKTQLEQRPVNETILKRKNIIVLVDEADRTQYGILAGTMRAMFKSAFFVGFTGTPLATKGKDTFAAFSPEGEDYLDKYFIDASIEDGFTLPIAWQLKVESVVNFYKEKLDDAVESFLAVADVEELSEETIKQLESEVAKKLNVCNVVLENQKMIEEVAKDIAKDFRENLDDRFKALVVTASRKACVLYKRELDIHLPKEYSEIVMTYTPEDDELIKEYERELKKRYGTNEIDDINQKIREDFNRENLPKILIVTDMLLRGFNAPILHTLYLIKFLKGHRLLQTIARVNRPYKGKDFGRVVDYVGILGRLEKALEMYQREDIANVARPIAEYATEFKEEMKKMKERLGENTNQNEKFMKAKVMEILQGGKEKEFVNSFRKIRKLYELLGPNEIKTDFHTYYQWLCLLYEYYKKINPDVEDALVEKLYKHTMNAVKEGTEFYGLRTTEEKVQIDTKFIDEVKPSIVGVFDAYAKVRNIIRSNPKIPKPVYQQIVEKVERIIDDWKKKKISAEQTCKEIKENLEELENIPILIEERGLSEMAYSIGQVLVRNKIEFQDEELRELERKIKPHMFYAWVNKPSAVKSVGREIRTFLIEKKIEKEKRDRVYDQILQMLKENF
ncbi:MAG: HsdR family type I site-specific deoxyribonuclease [Thermoplasmata archaeon]